MRAFDLSRYERAFDVRLVLSGTVPCCDIPVLAKYLAHESPAILSMNLSVMIARFTIQLMRYCSKKAVTCTTNI